MVFKHIIELCNSDGNLLNGSLLQREAEITCVNMKFHEITGSNSGGRVCGYKTKNLTP